MVIRQKNIKGNSYWYEQRSERVGGKVKTRHVRYIGKAGGRGGDGQAAGVAVSKKTEGFIEEVETKKPKTAREGLAIYRKHKPSLRELNKVRKEQAKRANKADKKRLSRKSPGPLEFDG